MSLNQTRTMGVFSLNSLKLPAGHFVAIIGVGATGSALALQLAKLDVPLMLIDPDVVESHNIPNQMLYGPANIGELKVEAAARRLRDLTDVEIKTSAKKILGVPGSLNHAFVFCCVDSMESRKAVFQAAMVAPTGAFCDVRISSRDFISIYLPRNNIRWINAYESVWYPDTEVMRDAGSCGNTLSIGSTALHATSHAVWQFMNHVSGRTFVHKIDGSLDPCFLQSTNLFEVDDGK